MDNLIYSSLFLMGLRETGAIQTLFQIYTLIPPGDKHSLRFYFGQTLFFTALHNKLLTLFLESKLLFFFVQI